MMADTQGKGGLTKAGKAPAEPGAFMGREAIVTDETVKLTPEQVKARGRRSLWIALALVVFVALIFIITVTKLGANVMVRDL